MIRQNRERPRVFLTNVSDPVSKGRIRMWRLIHRVVICCYGCDWGSIMSSGVVGAAHLLDLARWVPCVSDSTTHVHTQLCSRDPRLLPRAPTLVKWLNQR